MKIPSVTIGMALIPSAGASLFGDTVLGALDELQDSAGTSLFGDSVLGALDGLRGMTDKLNLEGRLFPPTLLEVEFQDFENPTFGGTKGVFPAITAAFTNLLEAESSGSERNCFTASERRTPDMSKNKDFISALPDFFDILSLNTCAIGAPLLAPSLFLKEKIAQPIVDLFTIFNENIPTGARKLTQQQEEQKRRLQTSPSNLQCVERLEEGSLDGLLQRPPDLEFFRGSTNRYTWAQGFNPDLGFGVTVHSLGAPGALLFAYSLPTFTIRDRDANTVFQGVLAGPGLEDINNGIRAAAVTSVDTTGGDTVITVLAARLGVPLGEFLEFKFSLNDYIANGRQPIEGLRSTRSFPFESSSVRSIEQVTPNLIFYAPTFDVTGIANEPTFFRFFDLTTWSNVGPRIFPSNDGERIPGIIWDFECSFEPNGLCFLNTIGIDFGDREEFFDENTVPVTFYFPFSSIPTDVITFPTTDEVDLETIFIENSFDIGYSAQSFEPVSNSSSVVCTLSGFLFRAGSVTANPGAVTPDEEVLESLLTLDGFRRFLELGEPQQCELCTGEIEVEEPMDGRRRTNANRRHHRNRGLQGSRGKGGSGGGGGGNSRNRSRSKNKNAGKCERIDFVNQPSTTAYVWDVEECGGKIFAGTYDIASVVGELLLDSFFAFIAFFVCESPTAVALACASSPGECGIDPAVNRAVCETSVDRAINDALPSGFRVFFATTLASILFETEVTPFDVGFDLYVAEAADILEGTAEFVPITQNGFRELSPAQFESDPIFSALFGFEPSSQNDEAVRTLSCTKSESGDTLVVGSAVFRADASSNTFLVDTQCLASTTPV